MKKLFKNVFSSAVSKIIVIAIVLVSGAIVDVQILKANVNDNGKEISEIKSNNTIERKILCKMAMKMQAFKKDEDNLCLELIR